ncbi:MAG: response regulator transcription factor [Syntrophobacteraceae bacterium]|jgi:two-component system response regulator CpxR
MNHLLIVDDDAAFCEIITDYLKPEEFKITLIHSGTDALQHVLACEVEYDLILLDTTLSGMNGFEVLQRIRSRINTPVILLSDTNRKIDRIVGLEIGADDLLAKPCDPRELLATVRAIFRRTQTTHKDQVKPVHEKIAVGDIALDTVNRGVFRNGEEIRLTPVEFLFLETLLREAGNLVTRGQLARRVLGRDLCACGRSMDIHLSRLRKKLGHKCNGVERIRTVRGVGFIYKIPIPFESVSKNSAQRQT